MPRFTETRVFPNDGYFPPHTNPAKLVVDAGSGTVAVAFDIGNGTFIAAPESPYSSDTVVDLSVANARIQISVTGNAAYGFLVG